LPIEPLSRARKTLVRSLHRKKGRFESGAFLAEGERLVSELAKSPGGLRFLFGTSDRIGWIEERFGGAQCFAIDNDDADLFATEQAQGIGAVVDIPAGRSFEELARGSGPVIYLDGVSDPGNAGTILRTAEWFGADGVAFGSGSVDPFNPKAVRASMGAIFHMPVADGVGPADLMSSGLPVVALDAGGDELLGSSPLPRHAIYVVGSEAHGITPAIRDGARLVGIGGEGRVESLNAAIAAAILLYEIFRPATYPPEASRSGRP
jgi:RNA methyltransferase, TrmH family